MCEPNATSWERLRYCAFVFFAWYKFGPHLLEELIKNLFFSQLFLVLWQKDSLTNNNSQLLRRSLFLSTELQFYEKGCDALKHLSEIVQNECAVVPLNVKMQCDIECKCLNFCHFLIHHSWADCEAFLLIPISHSIGVIREFRRCRWCH